MRIDGMLRVLAVAGVLAVTSVVGVLMREWWIPLLRPEPTGESVQPAGETATPTGKIIVNEQAQENLGLTARPLTPRTYWRTIQVPGMIVDRPGVSDRGVPSPVAGVVSRISHVPGDTVRPGEALFTLKVLSESLHQVQTDLFKATQDIRFARSQMKTLTDSGGAIPAARIIDVDNQIARLDVALKAYRRELLNRGIEPAQIEGIAAGMFVNEITVPVPPGPLNSLTVASPPPAGGQADPWDKFEVQDLKVDLGQLVQVGQQLCTLSNHRMLTIEGRAFREEAPLLERSVSERWPVEVDFQEEGVTGWNEIRQEFRIRHLSNTIDAVTRTFAFRMPLENDSRVVEDHGFRQILWRFRPGQKVRLHVRVEELKNVFVLPADAVTRDGPESFIFTQNVNTFTRRPVRVLLQDRRQVVIANDGSIPAGTHASQSAAAQLNRMVKAGGASGVPKGYHVHADGSLHKNEDEGK